MGPLGKEALRMDSPKDVFAAQDRCEVCGAELGDEVVIQEFADGSLARLCPECAAGAALDEQHPGEDVSAEEPLEALSEASPDTLSDNPSRVIWPEETADPASDELTHTAAEVDPLEKTRELLLPVTDLIVLQGEMQSALERLASSLERFAAEMLTGSQDKTAIETRLQMLERELDKTRTRLEETEFLLASTLETAPGALGGVTGGTAPAPGTAAAEVPAAAPPDEVATQSAALDAAPVEMSDQASETSLEPEQVSEGENLWTQLTSAPTGAPEQAELGVQTPSPAAVTGETVPAAIGNGAADTEPASGLPAGDTVAAAQTATDASAEPAGEPPSTPEQVAKPLSPASDPQVRGISFRIDEVQATQRYYNESPFINRVRDVSNSLGKPKANLTRVPGEEPRAIVTITWDIVWYQYLVNLRRDLPSTQERVILHREGMDLDELAYYFRERNAVVNDDGRVDASELEVRLLSDPSALITEMTPVEQQALEDATEEIWDQHISPEFKWDD